MPDYIYKAAGRTGKVENGTMSAGSQAEVIQALRRRGLTLLELSESSARTRPARLQTPKLQVFGKKVKPMDIALFFRQLSITIKAGVSLTESLRNIAQEMDRSPLQTALFRVEQDLQDGRRFAEALERNNINNVFPPVALGLSRVAEETGTLDSTLDSLADYLEASHKMKGAIKSKTAYPTFMIVAFTLIMLFATFKLFPMFEENFSALGANLPALTLQVFALNRLALSIAPYVLGVLGLTAVGLFMFRMTPAGRRSFDGAVLRIPLLGNLLYKIGTGRFCYTLAVTSNGGVPLLEGLRISAGVLTNASLQAYMLAVREEVSNGKPLGKSIRGTGAFSGLVVRMIEVGEESGQLPLVLEKVSEIYDMEVDQAITKITSLIEPVIIVIFGVFVTIMVLALYMPIFSMSSNI